MNKIAVIFWTGTGNTEVMANEVVAGAKEAGADVTLFNTSAFSTDKARNLTNLLWAARQWVPKNSKIASSSRFMIS